MPREFRIEDAEEGWARRILMFASCGPALQRELERGFLGEGYQLRIADDEETLLRRLETETHHLLIMDFDRLSTAGWVFIEARRRVDPTQRLPLIALSERTDLDHVTSCFMLGASAFVPKPWDVRTMVSKAKKVACIYRCSQMMSDIQRNHEKSRESINLLRGGA